MKGPKALKFGKLYTYEFLNHKTVQNLGLQDLSIIGDANRPIPPPQMQTPSSNLYPKSNVPGP